ncbi:MAG: energy transducer TonB [Nitrospirota bacterium]
MKVLFSWLFYSGELMEKTGTDNIKVNYGLLISVFVHILIMVIPVSMAVVQKFNEIELFVMDEEKPIVQEQKIMKRQKMKAAKEGVKREEMPQKIEEKPLMQKEEIIESTMISNEKPATSINIFENPNPPEDAAREVASAPQISFPKQQLSQTQDIEFGSAEGPKFLHRELPSYPLIARRMGKEGRVILRLTIDKRGKLLNVEVIENAGYGFTEAAIEAVKRSTFLPAKRDGKPIASRALLPIRFILLENR